MKYVKAPLKVTTRKQGRVVHVYLLPVDQPEPGAADKEFLRLDLDQGANCTQEEAEEVHELVLRLSAIFCIAANAKLTGAARDEMKMYDLNLLPERN